MRFPTLWRFVPLGLLLLRLMVDAGLISQERHEES
jgi:hypothetical protein